jgi:hypothetical protein
VATTDVHTFLDAKRDDIAAIQDGGSDAFNRVLLVPIIDIDMLMEGTARWPAAFVTDGGGQLDNLNGKLWTRRMLVTVMDNIVRSDFGVRSLEQVLKKCDLVQDALEHTRSDSEIFMVADTDAQVEVLDEHTMFVYKTLTFQYTIEKA